MLQFFDKLILTPFTKDFINESFGLLHTRTKTCKINHLKLYYYYKLVTKFHSDLNIDNLYVTKSESKTHGYNIISFYLI